jgi:hypothetical protein
MYVYKYVQVYTCIYLISVADGLKLCLAPHLTPPLSLTLCYTGAAHLHENTVQALQKVIFLHFYSYFCEAKKLDESFTLPSNNKK